ncbi:MAG: hypothetical protein K6B75_05265 [Lachnospiraceae bacterium]|nr:hypothetical protein [Lachnospiraceae bacterium]
MALLIITLIVGILPAKAVFAKTSEDITIPTYNSEDKTGDYEVFIGEISTVSAINVYVGPGLGYSRLTVEGQKSGVKLYLEDMVAVIASEYSAEGELWYKVSWTKNDDINIYVGYVNSKYITVSEEIAMPLATSTPTPSPTPLPTNTPTPKPTNTPTPVITKAPTQAPSPVPTQPQVKRSLTTKEITMWVGAGALWVAAAAVVFLVISEVKRNKESDKLSKKADEVKQRLSHKEEAKEQAEHIATIRRKYEPYVTSATEKEQKEERKVLMEEAKIRRPFVSEDFYEDELQEDYSKNSVELNPIMQQMSLSLKAKEALRQEIFGLKEGDIVEHEYYGRGIVTDNTDVDSVEVQFADEVRYISKAGAVAKKLMRKAKFRDGKF